MTKPKQHHFVPKWYLEGFAEPASGFLHVYGRVRKVFWKQKPQEVMTIRRYYRQEWAPAGIDPDILEKALGAKLEPDAQKALARLIRMQRDATPEETATILMYLEMQRLRVPRQAEAARRFVFSAALQRFPPALATALLKGQITIDDGVRLEIMRMMLGQMTPFFGRMEWEVIEAAEGCSFITSDSPVSFFNVAVLPSAEPGFGLLGTMVLFPLDSKHLLLMHHPEYELGGPRSPTERVPYPPEEDGGIAVTYGQIWDENKVHRLNWTMLLLSHRLIVGASRAVVQKAAEVEPD